MSDLPRNALVWVAAVAVLFGTSGIAAAQIPYNPNGGAVNQPAYSPYMNLLNRGQSAGANYYGLVRPEMEFRSAYQGLQQQFNAQQNASEQVDQRSGLPITGHAATFLNYRGYFLTNSPAIGPRAGIGQGQQRQGAGTAGQVGQVGR